MAFMIPEFTQKIDWLVVDSKGGTDYIPLMDTGLTKADIQECEEWWLWDNTFIDCIRDFTCVFDVDDVYSIEVEEGYGARFSAPGYMDRTDWCIYDTPTAAIHALQDECDNETDPNDADFACLFRRQEQLAMIRWMKGEL